MGVSSEGVRRRGCSCSKEDFLPEESFKSWGNYAKALSQTGLRLKDRILTRSLDETEIHEIRARSQHDMKKNLSWWDLIWFGIGAVIGAGIFVLTGLEVKSVAGPAVVLSYVVSGISAMLSVFCYTEFAVEIPVAGGSFAYLRVELGDFMAFIAGGNILLEYIIGGAAVARSWTSYFATLCNHDPNDFRIHVHQLGEDYGYLDPISIGVIIGICILAVLSTKGSSRLNYIASIVHVIIIIFIIVAGFIKADTKNYTPFTPFGARGIFKASAVLFFAYVGFDAVSTMAEETKNPAKDIPIGLVGSMLITTTAYCLMAVTLCLMQPYSQVNEDAAFSVAFQAVGMNWAKYIVAVGALKGMTTVLLVNAVGQARYLTHIARTHMVPPWFAHVNEKTGTPINATIVMLLATAIIGFFTKLDILSNLLSISTLFIFMLVAVALLVRRYYVTGVTSSVHRNVLILCILFILGSSVAAAVYWATNETGYIAYIIIGPIWFLATLSLQVFVPQARDPKLWGVPLVPWLPSASIAPIFTSSVQDRMESLQVQIDDESNQDEPEVATWTDAEEKCFIDLMIHQVKANNRPTSTFNSEGWKYIVENFNKMNKKNYSREQFKNKYHQLRRRRSNYYTIVGYPGVSIDPVTKKPIANVDVWEMLYAKHKFSRQIRKKGCPFLDELDFVFSGISGNEDLPIGNSENPSNDEVKHVPETSDPHGTWAQNTAAIDENKLIESATWTNAEVKSFIELMVHQVKANNRPTSTFNTDGWKYIMENFNRINKKNYNKEQFKNKYHQLKTTHSNYYTIAGHAGVSIDPVTKKLKASTDVWESLYAKYKWAKKIRKKGCPYLDELDFIFLGTNASGDFAFGNNEDPSDDEIKHVPETLDPRGTWTQNTNANESAAEISQTDFIDESNERHTRKNNLLSLMRKSKKPRQSSKMMFAMQAWAEASKNKSKLYEMQLAEIKEARRQMQAQVEKRDTSVTKCMEVVNDIHAQHGLRIQQVKAATELFEKEHWRETFLGMSRDLQVAWLQDLQG